MKYDLPSSFVKARSGEERVIYILTWTQLLQRDAHTDAILRIHHPRLLPCASTSFLTQLSLMDTACCLRSFPCGPQSDDDKQQIGRCSLSGCHVADSDVAPGLSVRIGMEGSAYDSLPGLVVVVEILCP